MRIEKKRVHGQTRIKKGTREKGRDGGRFAKGMRMRPAFCRFCKDKLMDINYKNMSILERMINDRGKILTRRSTGNCAKHQRKVAIAIKRARFLSLIPYTR